MLGEGAERRDGNHSSSQPGAFRGGGLDVSRRVVDANGQVEVARLVVDREEVWIAGGAVAAFDTFLEYAASAVILRPPQLFHCLVDVEQRQNRDPAQPPAALLRGFGDPAIVRLAKRHVDFRSSGKSMEEKSRVENLHVDAQLVHVAYSGFDVQELAGRLHSSGSLVIAPASESDSAVDEPEAVRPAITRRRRSARIERDRLEAARAIVEIFPGSFRFVYVRIDVYAKHGSSFCIHQELPRS
jgi:hypothetical protein